MSKRITEWQQVQWINILLDDEPCVSYVLHGVPLLCCTFSGIGKLGDKSVGEISHRETEFTIQISAKEHGPIHHSDLHCPNVLGRLLITALDNLLPLDSRVASCKHFCRNSCREPILGLCTYEIESSKFHNCKLLQHFRESSMHYPSAIRDNSQQTKRCPQQPQSPLWTLLSSCQLTSVECL